MLAMDGDFAGCSLELKHDVLSLCEDVLTLFQLRFPVSYCYAFPLNSFHHSFKFDFQSGPVLGWKPIYLIRSPTPKVFTSALPERYLVGLSCLHSRCFDQLTYQLAHELGHVFLSPLVSQPFVEVLVVAISLAILVDMKIKWESDDSKQPQKEYAVSFVKYKAAVLTKARIECGVRADEDCGEWLQRLLCSRLTVDDRSEQIVAATEVEKLLRTEPTWSCLQFFHTATIDDINIHWSHRFDCSLWRTNALLYAKVERALLEQLCNLFTTKTTTASKSIALNPP